MKALKKEETDSSTEEEDGSDYADQERNTMQII